MSRSNRKASTAQELKFFGKSVFFWIVGAVCTFGCGYQVLVVTNTYFAYPSIVSSTYVKEAAEYPGVTVCPENWFNLSRVCQHLLQNCSRKNVMLLYSVPKAGVMSDYRYYGRPTIESLFDCRMISRTEACSSFDCTKFMKRAYFKVPVRYCFTIDASQLPVNHVFHDCSSPWLYELQIRLRWNESELLAFLGDGSMPVYVHQARTNPPTSIGAVSMFKDRIIEVTITQTTMVRLPRPFHAQCEDYQRKLFRPEWGGFHTHAGCIQECKMKTEQDICNCTLSQHEYSDLHAGKLCPYDKQALCTEMAAANSSHAACDGKCHLGCLEHIYDVRLSGISKTDSGPPKIHSSGLFLSFASPNVEHFQYNQAVGSEMTLGQISGYIGVWLGVSFDRMLQQLFAKMITRNDKARK